ncbi:MAG: pyruvate kinase [Candidatus Eisenbacteria bacterium]|uniref:Pyruvate kinase n=1 Tax=Eiseniibacteriota bacterium TaxID=2212470 RepID=A0A7Y2EB87_UNCEI|nr:pyruvate kinase [Candidatus Eisenbacteria bacterium]
MTDPLRRAKIVCTIGPSSSSPATLKKLIRAGMDVARLNFSHGTAADHEDMVTRLREASNQCRKTIAILQDLQGPKLRVGKISNGGMELKTGEKFVLTTEAGVSEPNRVSVSYSKLISDIGKGDRILLDDGLIEVEVVRIRGKDITTKVVTSGILTSNKGVNIPSRALSIPALTRKDRADLKLGLALGVDYVALSFVRDKKDVDLIQALIRRSGHDVPVIAKLEKPQAVENLDSIIEAADGIMVARGDLGVELPPEQVPVLQKRMIRKAREAGKPVITATQMLESMVQNPRPTRAEASDVANAIFDGTDAVMLSAETATGEYPIQTVQMMSRIIENAEQSAFRRRSIIRWADHTSAGTAEIIGLSATRISLDLNARLIATFTQSGSSARLVSKYRPQTPIVAFTSSMSVMRRLSLIWGVFPNFIPHRDNTDDMIDAVTAKLKRDRRVRKGDRIVVTAGTPMGTIGSTNFLKVHLIP